MTAALALMHRHRQAAAASVNPACPCLPLPASPSLSRHSSDSQGENIPPPHTHTHTFSLSISLVQAESFSAPSRSWSSTVGPALSLSPLFSSVSRWVASQRYWADSTESICLSLFCDRGTHSKILMDSTRESPFNFSQPKTPVSLTLSRPLLRLCTQ